MKTVLITGANSYIGTSFESYAKEHYGNQLYISTIDMMDGNWKNSLFRDENGRAYDIVFHVAGLAHADTGNVSDETKKKYYAVNTDLAIECCRHAKESGCGQFVFMSSAIIYGDSAPLGKSKMITKETEPKPSNFYGDSKWQADKGVRSLACDGKNGEAEFIVTVLRPPMIYGKGSKGNYPQLSNFARKSPLFPDVQNERSMLYIENLCEFLCQVMIRGDGGVFWPQNASYSNTSKMVKYIGNLHNHKVILSKLLGLGVKMITHIPGKVGGIANKAFGNLTYDMSISTYDFEYQKYSLKESLNRTEINAHEDGEKQKHILLISQYFHPETFRVNDMACEWVKRGYKVTVLTGIPNYPMGKFFDGYDRKHRTRETWEGVNIIRIPLIARGNSANKLINALGMTANYLSFIIAGRRWVKSSEAKKLNADIVFTVEVSPMTQALIGVWYSKRYDVPSFLYVQDLWPENVETVTGIHSRIVLDPIDRMVDKIYRETEMIFTTSPSFVEAIVNRKVPVDRKKVFYWSQYAEDFYKPMKPVNIDAIDKNDGCYRIAFTGNIGTAQGLDVLPEAAELLKNEKVKFVIVGDGRYQREFEQQIRDHNVQNMFTMIPRVPAEQIPGILSNCDAGFISFNNTPLWKNTIPAKLQSYMACGKAIIASAAGETKRVISEAGCGVCAEIGNSRALADGIKELMRMNSEELGAKAREYFEVHYDKKVLMDEMEVYLKRVI